ncbi:MAG: PKD domain-containing protein [Thermoplasmata archaeon]|nr:PKD domain-containing protein [Thermoplasmata archaeon]
MASGWRRHLHRGAWWVPSVAVFAVLVLIGSALAQPPPGHYYPSVTGGPPATQTIYLWNNTPFTLTLTGGEVSTSSVAYYYHLYWFFGDGNSSGNYDVAAQAVAPPASCTITSNCAGSTTAVMHHIYNRTGSFDVSVTIYDGQFDYTIFTFVVNVVAPPFTLKQFCGSAAKGSPYADQLEEFWFQGEFTSNGSAYSGLTYTYDWGDGSSTQGIYFGGCYLVGYDGFAQHRWTTPADYLVTVTAFDPRDGMSGRVYFWENVTNPQPSLYTVYTPASVSVNSPFTAAACVQDSNYAVLNNLTLIWNFGVGTDVAVSTAGGALGCGGLGSVGGTVAFVYTASGVFSVTVRAVDPWGDASASASGSITASYSATANTTTTLPGTIGGWERLNAAMLTSIATPSAGLAYAWDTGNVVSHGPQDPVIGYRPITQTTSLWVNTSGHLLVHTTQAIAWSDPMPVIGVNAFYVAPSQTMTLKMSTPNCWSSVSGQLTVQGQTYSIGSINSPALTLTLNVPPQVFLGQAVLVMFSYTPNLSGGCGHANVIGTLTLGFPGGAGAVTQHTFTNGVPGTYVYLQNLLALALGEPVTLSTSIFSPAQVGLNATWAWGDSTTNGAYSLAMPSTPSPTSKTVLETHTWAAGKNYVLTITLGDGKLTQTQTFKIFDSSVLNVNDTAPSVTLAAATTYVGEPVTLTTTVTESDPIIGAKTPSWTLGDGGTGTGTSVTHLYVLGAKYVAAVYDESPNGSTSVAWAFVTVREPTPSAYFTLNPLQSSVDLPVTGNGTRSTEDGWSSVDLSYLWSWGDSSQQGGPANVAASATHEYAAPGTFTIALTVMNSEGGTAASTTMITVSALSLAATLPNVRVAADRFSNLTPIFTSLPTVERPFVNVTWNWGDFGLAPSPSSWDLAAAGIVAGHTWVVPGTYQVSATITDVHGGTPTHPSATLTVYDPAPVLTSNYVGGIVAGMNHTALFHALALGTWADVAGYATSTWNFNWQWGDGSAATPTSTPNDPAWSAPSHAYRWSGPVEVNLTVTAPWPSSLRTGSVGWSASVVLIPDWDGDGLPNAYETGVTHTNPGLIQTAGVPGDQMAPGYGLTDFLAARLALGNLSDDPDGDGLSSMQELLGSVTGFPSNPLDPNTAGDGVLDGAHYSTDTFPASQVVSLPTTITTSVLYFPNVGYYGPGIGFNTSQLSLVFETPNPSALANLQMTLYAPDGNGFTIPDPSTNWATDYLLNMTPFGPAVTQFGVSLNDFTQSGTWALVINTYTNVPGSITAASLSVSYHTDPVNADPLHQGLLEEHGLTTAIYNCSAPSNVNYTAFNQATMLFSPVNFWPYSETYYKLSVLQGIPYVTGNSAQILNQNQASGRCPSGMVALEGHTASYLGDADFGISPWVAHAAGDPSLTNGMKALGATNYTRTAGLFETYPTGSYAPAPTASLYAADPLEFKSGNPDYQLPLNPTALSTAGTGVPDSAAADPLHPVGLALTVVSSVDPTNVCTWVAPQYIVEVEVTNWSTGTDPVMYSLTATGSGAQSCSTGDSASYYGSSFTLPLDNSASGYSIELLLWQTGTLGAEGFHARSYLSGTLTNTGIVSTPTGASIYATAQVTPMQRVPVVFVNTTNEIENLPGYGERYVGDANGLDAFYVNMASGTPPTDFQSGLNLVLESQAAIAQSSFNNTLFTSGSGSVPGSLSCFSSFYVSTRSSQPSPGGINQTWSGNLSGSSESCGTTLLTTLTPLSKTGTTIGAISVLGTDAFERLGFGVTVVSAAPLVPIPGFTDSGGGGATNWIQDAQNAVVGALNFIAQAILAVASFVASLATDLANWFTQSVLGAFAAAVAGAEAIAHAIEQIVSWLVHEIITLLLDAALLIKDFFEHMALTIAKTTVAWELSFAYDLGIITTLGEYNSDYQAFFPGPTPPAPVSLSSVQSDWTNLDTILLAGAGSIIAGFAVANAAADAISAGGAEAVEMTVAQLVESTIEGDLTTDVQAAAQAVTSSILVAVISDIGSNSANLKTDAQSLGFILNAANQIVTWVSAFNDYGTWELVKGSNFASAYIFSMVLDFAAAAVSAIGYVILTIANDNSLALFFGVLGLILAGVSFGYQMSLASDAIGTFLFPLGPALYVTTGFSIGSAGYTALTAQ